jgi:hypothetical protein
VGTTGTGTAGSTTGTAGSTTGGTTGSTADAGCGPSGYGNEFDDCSTNGVDLVCACNLTCTKDTGTLSGKACEQSCSVSTDCADPATLCVGSFCQLNACGTYSDGGGNGKENLACNALGTGDGTCINNPYQGGNSNFNSSYPFVCVRPGTATNQCVDPQFVSTAATTCPVGQTCSAPTLLHNTANGKISVANGSYRVPAGSYDLGVCAPLCDLTGKFDAGCPSGQACLATGPGDKSTGVCSADGGNGCAAALTGTEFGGERSASCNTNFDCACPQYCVNDAFFGQVCEAPCSVDSDCPNAGDTCAMVGDGGVCIARLCGGVILPDSGVANPAYLKTCTVKAANDGTCVPMYSDAVSNGATGVGNIGICYLGGTATTTCDPTMANNAATLCATGSFCFGGQCLTLCDPSATSARGGNGCPAGVACYQFNSNIQAGVCLGACIPMGLNCNNSSDCCSFNCGGAVAGVCN